MKPLPRRFRPLVERFWSHVNKSGPMPSPEAVAVWPEIAGTPCWIYGKDPGKYRLVSLGPGQPNAGAHRVAWFLATGKWTKLDVCHKCDVKACVRFEHLFKGTHTKNMRDMAAKGRAKFFGGHGGHRKVTAEDVAEIRRLGAPCVRHPRKRGTVLLKKLLARRFNLRPITIEAILARRRW
jgi:HNH endonuclease